MKKDEEKSDHRSWLFCWQRIKTNQWL